GCSAVRLDVSRLAGRIAARGEVSAGPVEIDSLAALVVRLIPAGSLEQVVFRVDALHLLADGGLPIVNAPRCIERTVDKHWTSRLLHDAGIPTPRTVAAEGFEDALQAYRDLGGDVVVKPLLGSGGRGIFRVSDEDLARRSLRALESSSRGGASRRRPGASRPAGRPTSPRARAPSRTGPGPRRRSWRCAPAGRWAPTTPASTCSRARTAVSSWSR
ncbi:MAG: hypothetical protein DMF50_12335, partial [Acidobacteria bacterium]